MLNALGLLDEDGNFKVDQTITLDGQVLTLAAVMELLENPATDLTRIADVDGTPVALGDLKTMVQIEQELQRIKDTYFSGTFRCFFPGRVRLFGKTNGHSRESRAALRAQIRRAKTTFCGGRIRRCV